MEDKQNSTPAEEEILTEEKEQEQQQEEPCSDTEEKAETAEEGNSESGCAEEHNCEGKSTGKEKKKVKKLEAEVEKLSKERDTAQKELAQASDKYMRLFAEYENFRKRSAKEREGVYADAYIDALTQILPVLDNLERAAQYNEEEEESPLAKGLNLTLKSFYETLAKMGVCEIEAQGKTFDPNIHNAVMHVEDEAFGENEIVEVFMKGYIKGDKVLRHSMVKVAN